MRRGCLLNNYVYHFVDMNRGIEHCRQINLFHRTGNDAGISPKSRKPMTLRHIIAIN